MRKVSKYTDLTERNPMSDIDLQYELMMEGRMNLMHLPPGAIAWLWDRPSGQVDAAEELAVAAKRYGNPVVDASLLKADPNVMLIKCEGGECFRIYPDGGYSYQDSACDIGGCESILMGSSPCDPDYDEFGHTGIQAPRGPAVVDGMDNMAGAVMDDVGGDYGGPGTMNGMGTGSPYVGDVGDPSMELDNMVSSRELGENLCKDDDVDTLAYIAESMKLGV